MPNTTAPPRNEPVANKRFADFHLGGKVSPGHVETPMVRAPLDKDADLYEIWSRDNMLGRLPATSEVKGAAPFSRQWHE
ncbi:NAD(P)-binding domain protein [Metarhizium guizhouense ARSEF 977]|uniref:NAD(P)-binding domain protein n=1 Tax=Metarhizium guizhouense (strain ARSEF 977) TaxID=1276136 RepID=A0A0B4I1I5_METGA|nr:NAD(P)-binding domain protein [Metarhizium guizhouense ARSEF 977]